MFKLLILCGSLRAQSASRALSRTIEERLTGKMDVRTFDIRRLPHYDADLADQPDSKALKLAIAEADGVLFVSPEYNYSVPGVLKNAIDWASRPAYASVFKGKPCFVISVSGGAMGGVRAQSHLKYILNGMLASVYPAQEVVVPYANAKVDNGVFADEAVLEFALAALASFADWAQSGRTG